MTFDARERSAWAGEPLDFYKITCGNSAWYFASGDAEVLYAGHTFTPEPMHRSELAPNGEDDLGRLELDGLSRENPVARLFLEGLPLHPVLIEAFTAHRDDAEVRCFFRGEILHPEFRGSEARLICQSVGRYLTRQIPRNTFQALCNWALFELPCGLVKSSYRVTAEVSHVDGIVIRASAFGEYPDDYFRAGWVETPAGELQFVTVHTADALTLMSAFRALEVGATIYVYPGCPGTIAACKGFGNLQHFGGFPFMPDRNPFETGIV